MQDWTHIRYLCHITKLKIYRVMKMKIELTLEEVKEVINTGSYVTSNTEISINKGFGNIRISIFYKRGDEIEISGAHNYNECEADYQVNAFEYDELKEMLTKRLLK